MDLAISHSQDEDTLQAIARLMQSVITARGARLAIVKKVSSEHIMKIHSDLIDYTLSKYLTLRDQNKTAERNMAITLFKALSTLTLGVDAQDALRMYVLGFLLF